MTEDTMIAALRREREGYAALGLDDRVAEVDEQLRLRGVQPPAAGSDVAAGPSTRTTPPKGRRVRGAEQA
ncbi:hypothetical protein [Streptomyces sp. NPDC088766]|uniref:hypothetical protein n=1 Tax=Streptomyces sp. NPDC088766 TaxID=3365893 RepID=UPI0037F148D2